MLAEDELYSFAPLLTVADSSHRKVINSGGQTEDVIAPAGLYRSNANEARFAFPELDLRARKRASPLGADGPLECRGRSLPDQWVVQGICEHHHG
jgi:hypothetical protein